MEKKDKEGLKKSLLWTIIVILLLTLPFGGFMFGKLSHNKDCGGAVRQSDAEKLQLKADKFLLGQKVDELNAKIVEAEQKTKEAEDMLKAKKREVTTALADLAENKDLLVALERQNKKLQLQSEKNNRETALLESERQNKEAKRAKIEATQKELDDRIKGKRYDAHGKVLVVGNLTPGYKLRVYIPEDAKEPLATLAWNEHRAFPYEGFDSIPVRVEVVLGGFDGRIDKVPAESFQPKFDSKTEKYNGVWIYRLINGVMLRTQDRNALPLQF